MESDEAGDVFGIYCCVDVAVAVVDKTVIIGDVNVIGKVLEDSMP